jgi:hypothetical protein
MKPGRGLIGNAEEEADFYRSREPAPRNNSEEREGSLEEISDEEDDLEMAAADFKEYKAPKKKMKEEDEEDLGEFERLSYGHDYLIVPGINEPIPVWEYFGSDWDARIVGQLNIMFAENEADRNHSKNFMTSSR